MVTVLADFVNHSEFDKLVRVRSLCTVDGCDRKHLAKGLCGRHYQRARAPRLPTNEELYEAKIDRSGGPEACHPWTRSVNSCGYGQFNHDGESLAARWGYKHYVGPLANDEVVRHTCDNPPCQNRRHWVKGTQVQNIYDAVERQRQHRPMGERNVKARLTEEQVRAIRADLATPRKVMAVRYGVNVATICAVQNRVTWKHVA